MPKFNQSNIWIAKKSEKKGVYFSSYLWENVFWELCKENFTENVTTQYGVVNILGIETPQNDHYMILEALNSEEILKKNTKIVHIIDFKQLKELTVGRGHDNKVRITDISISRLHWKFFCKNNQIYIDDLGSKFGSLIAEKRPLDLSTADKDTFIQIGRTLLIFNVKKPNTCWCRLVKPNGLSMGINYSSHVHYFPSIYKKMYKQIYSKHHRRNTAFDEKGMKLSDELLN